MVLAALGFALPVAAYFWLIQHYAINEINGDQWDNVALIGRSYNGTLGLGALWAQHNENRMLFPNLVVLLLAHSTRFNVVLEEYLSGVMLVAAAGLLIWAHKRRSPSTPLVYYCPVALLMLSLVQSGNTLWGFQMAWYLVMLSLAGALFLLDGPGASRFALAGAIGAAVVGSFSSFQGLLIWPVGLVLLYHRRRSLGQVGAWLASAALTGGLYFYHFNTQAGVPSYLTGVHFPAFAAKFFFLAIGDVVGARMQTGNDAVLVLGVLIFLAGISVVAVYGLRRDRTSGSPIGVALVCFGILFVLSIAYGRAWQGAAGAAASRFTTFDLLIPVGCYLAVLNRPLAPARLPRPWGKGWVLALARSFVLGVICLQVILGIENGIANARESRRYQVTAADVLVNIDAAPNQLVQSALAPGRSTAALLDIRQLTRVVREHRLSLFDTQAAARYRQEGLPADRSPPSTKLLRPENGAELRSIQPLAADASDNVGVTRVEFRVTGGGLTNLLVGVGSLGRYGWVALWNTTGVTDGTFSLQSVAYDGAGNSARSPALTVRVEN